MTFPQPFVVVLERQELCQAEAPANSAREQRCPLTAVVDRTALTISLILTGIALDRELGDQLYHLSLHVKLCEPQVSLVFPGLSVLVCKMGRSDIL